MISPKVTGRILPISKSTAERNPHLFDRKRESGPMLGEQPALQPKRIRQDSRPLMNKLEAEWFAVIKDKYPNYPPVRAQAKRYKLGNGIWFKVDFTATLWPCESGPSRETAWEVKGPHAFRGGFENLKVAASLWPEVQWILVWKEDGAWRQQTVLP